MTIRRMFQLACRVMASNFCDLRSPYRLTYAVTNRCQARCSMCGIWAKAPEDELTVSEIDALFSHANRFSWINLTGGELFQRPDIRDVFLAVIGKSTSLYLLNFPTNGFQTDVIVDAVDTILERTALPRLIVSVSLDGPPLLHDSIRGLNGSWECAMQTFMLLRKRHSSRFSTYLGHTLQAANLGRFDEMVESCRQLLPSISADDFHINVAHRSGFYYANDNFDILPESAEVSPQLAQIMSRRSNRICDPVAIIERRYLQFARTYLKYGRVPLVCQAAAVSCFIDPKGMVYPCSGFDLPLGSLRENGMDLSRIWGSKRHSTTRRLICEGECPGCWTPCEAYQTLLANVSKRFHP